MNNSNTYHIPVLLRESVEALKVNSEGIYVDLTFGGGGHTKEILRQGAGRVIGFDQDKDASRNMPDDERFTLIQHNFRYLKYFLRYLNITKVDGVLADLGVSSHEFDEAGRGFSYRFDSELDMRMNQSANITAYEIVNEYDESQLCYIFRNYGDLKDSMRIAKKIIKARDNGVIKTTIDLANCVGEEVPPYKKNAFLSKVFQAIRIEVNDELGALIDLLEQLPEVLKVKARLAIISYHSLEDRLVKRFIKAGNVEGNITKDFYGNILSPIKGIGKVKVPKEEEVVNNTRSRSAKLRVAERL